MVMPIFAKGFMAKMGYFECLSTIVFVIANLIRKVGP
jgi:hypothetical protein